MGGIMRALRASAFAAALLITAGGCERYSQRPLAVDSILISVEQERHLADAAASSAPVEFSLGRAVELMKVHSPVLKEVRAEYDSAQALACVKTPLPNPAFEAGPMYGFGPDVSHLHRLQPFGSLGFSIPTGQRLKRQDELNQALAERAHVEIEAKYRELYLELRKSYIALALSHSDRKSV